MKLFSNSNRNVLISDHEKELKLFQADHEKLTKLSYDSKNYEAISRSASEHLKNMALITKQLINMDQKASDVTLI